MISIQPLSRSADIGLITGEIDCIHPPADCIPGRQFPIRQREAGSGRRPQVLLPLGGQSVSAIAGNRPSWYRARQTQTEPMLLPARIQGVCGGWNS